jgi:transcriptional regulator of heat shock response
MDLTDRQTRILKGLVEDYIETGQPVGSENLEKKHEIGVSPATIRNEMVVLTKAGLLKKDHASAGRIPTKDAFKFYVNQLIEEKKLSVAEEVEAKEKIWDSRFDFDKLMKQATKALADKTRMLAVSATKDGEIYHAGYAHILEMPEFYDIDVTRSVLSLLDEVNRIQDLFAKSFGEGPIHMLLGDELGYELLEPCGMVFTHFQAGEHSGALGVVGTCRLNYPFVIPVVRYFGRLVEELAASL